MYTHTLTLSHTHMHTHAHTHTHTHTHTHRWTGPEDLGELGQYYGIFDGHGGIFTPEYLARHLHKSLHSRKIGLVLLMCC
jgi:serine/threonine protein phosphatase PrpC